MSDAVAVEVSQGQRSDAAVKQEVQVFDLPVQGMRALNRVDEADALVLLRAHAFPQPIDGSDQLGIGLPGLWVDRPFDHGFDLVHDLDRHREVLLAE